MGLTDQLAALFSGGSGGPPDTTDPTVLYGVRVAPGYAIDGFDYLKGQLDNLFAMRISRLPGVPADWLANVRRIQAANPGNLIRIAVARDLTITAAPASNHAWFLDTPAKLDAWQQIYERSNQIIGDWAANPDPGYLSRFYSWVTNDDSWVGIEAAFAAAARTAATATTDALVATGQAAKDAYNAEVDGFAALGGWIERNNPITQAGKWANQITIIVVALVCAVIGFYAWRSGLLAGAGKALDVAATAAGSKAKRSKRASAPTAAA